MSTASKVPNTTDTTDDQGSAYHLPPAARIVMGYNAVPVAAVKPLLVSATPADDLSAVAVTSDIVLHFNTSMLAGSGSIVISDGRSQSYVSSNGTLMSRLVGATDTRSISVSDSQITIDGQDVTIHLNSALKAGTSYSVTMADGALQSTDYLSYAGLATATQLNFTTATSASRSAPVAAVSGAIHFNDNGISASDYLTSSASQTISGSYSGTLASGDFIQVSLDNGASWNKAVANSSLHTWSYSGTIAGSSTMLARVSNIDGLNSGTTSQAYVLNTATPTAYVTGTATFSTDSGSSASDLVTNVAAQTISGHYTGTIAAGEVLAVSLDKGVTWAAATVDTDAHTWTYAATLTGSSTLLARVMTLAGNYFLTSEQPIQNSGLAYSYTAGTSLAGHALALAAGSDTGTAGDNITSAVAGVTLNVAGLANLHVGDVIRILDTSNNSAVVGSYTLGAIDLDHYGTGHLVDHGYGDNITTLNIGVSGLGNGAHTLVAQVFDIAGNLTATPTSALSVNVTSTPPGTPASLAGATVNLQPDAANDSGSSHSDNITKTTLPAIVANVAGITLHVGDVVQLLDGGNLIASKTLASGDLNNGAVIGGTLTFTPGDALAEGTHSLTVRALDSNSTAGTPSNATVVTIDTTAPASLSEAIVNLQHDATNDTGASTSDCLTNNATPAIVANLAGVTGLQAGDIVQLLDGTTVVASISLASSDLDNGVLTAGTVSLTPTAALADGAHNLTVRIADLAGNTGTASDVSNIVIDTVGPSLAGATLGLKHDAANDTGSAQDDNLTKTTLPQVTVNLAGVTGLEVGGGLLLLDGGQNIIGHIVFAESDLSAGNVVGGSYTFTLDNDGVPLTDGVHQLTVRALDAAGNMGAPSAATAITVDATGPVLTGVSLGLQHDAANDTGGSQTDNITSNKLPAIVADLSGASGLVAGGGVQVMDGNQIIAHKVFVASDLSNGTVAGGSLTLAIDTALLPNGLADGTHQLTLRAIDAAGNYTDSAATAVTVDTQARSMAGATLSLQQDADNDTGLSQTDNITNLSHFNLVAHASFGGFKVGDVLQVLEGSTVVASKTLAGSDVSDEGVLKGGAVTFTLSGSLGPGVHNLTLRDTDAAGNSGAVNTATAITVDQTAPVSLQNATVNLRHDADNDTGISASDDFTGNDTPAIEVHLTTVAGLQIGDLLQLLDGTHVIASKVLDGDDLGNDTIVLYPDEPLVDGEHSLTVRTYDVAGNPGVSSAAAVITIDATAPNLTGAAVALVHDEDNDTGSRQDDNVTSATQPHVTVDLNGITGLEAGGGLLLFDGGQNFIGHHVFDSSELDSGSLVGGIYTFTLTAPLADGTHNLQVVAVNAAGVRGMTESSTAIVIDTQARSVSGAIIHLVHEENNDSGSSQSDNITNAQSPLIAVAIDGGGFHVGDMLQLFDGTMLVNTVELSAGVVYGDGNILGAITFWPLQSLGEGDHSLTVRLLDPAGNTSGNSPATVITIDTTAAASMADATLGLQHDADNDTGFSTSDNRTMNASPTLVAQLAGVSGLRVGDLVEVLDDGNVVAHKTLVTADLSAASISFTLDAALAEGEHHLIVRATDLAGNQGMNSTTATTVIVDSTAPVLDGDNSTTYVTVPASTTTLTVAFDSDMYVSAGTSVKITGGNSSPHVIVISNSNISGKVLSIPLNFALDSGTGYQVTLETGTINDLAGNAGASGHADLLEFNTEAPPYVPTPPSAPTFTLHDTASVTDPYPQSAAHSDFITSDRTVTVSGVSSDNQWRYSTDAGLNWNEGHGDSFTLPASAATYAVDQIQVKQFYVDMYQNEVASTAATNAHAWTIDVTGPAAYILEAHTFSSSATTVEGTYFAENYDAASQIVEVSFDGGASWVRASTSVPGEGYLYINWSASSGGGYSSNGFVSVRMVDIQGALSTQNNTHGYPLYYGSSGDDNIELGEHAIVFARDGNDSVVAGDHADLDGGDGNNHLTAGDDAYLSVGFGSNVIVAGDDAYLQIAYSANYNSDTPVGDNDITVGKDAEIHIYAGNGNTIHAGDGANIMLRAAVSHSITLSNINTQHLVSGGGIDTLNLAISNKTVSLAALSTTYGMSGMDIINFTGTGDVINVNAASDVTSLTNGILTIGGDNSTVVNFSEGWSVDSAPNPTGYTAVHNGLVIILIADNITYHLPAV